jgi:hypothetical protein
VLQQLNYSPYNLGIDLDDIPWEELPRDIFKIGDTRVRAGGRQKVIYTDPKTGATMILLNAPKGVSDPRHIHLEANQWSFGIDGECVSYTGTTWQLKNSVGYYPKGMPHGGDTVIKDTLCLVFWDGPRT